MVSRAINGAIAALTMVAAGAVSAQETTYDYTGAPMSGIEIGAFVGANVDSELYSYCCAALDGSVTFPAPLEPNLDNVSVYPTAMTFSFTSSGGSIGASADPHLGTPYSVGPAGGPQLTPFSNEFGGSSALPRLIGTISVSTNGAGEITSWSVDARTPPSGSPDEWDLVSTPKGDSLTAGSGTHGPLYTLSNRTAGSWTRRHSTLSRRSTELARRNR